MQIAPPPLKKKELKIYSSIKYNLWKTTPKMHTRKWKSFQIK